MAERNFVRSPGESRGEAAIPIDRLSHYLIDCGNEERQRLMLDFNNGEVEGLPYKVYKTMRQMSGEEILKWVMERLVDDERQSDRERSLGLKSSKEEPK